MDDTTAGAIKYLIECQDKATARIEELEETIEIMSELLADVIKAVNK